MQRNEEKDKSKKVKFLNSSISRYLAMSVIASIYIGFAVITNTVEDLNNPKKNLPRAIYLSILLVTFLYLLISIAVTGTLSGQEIIAAKDYALAAAAKPLLGTVGFTIMGVTALLSTASAINASLYGAANISYNIAKIGELPPNFDHKVWKEGTEGLLITSFLIILIVLFLDLTSIASLASLVFLIIYIIVNLSHFRLYKKTGASPVIIGLGIILCLTILVLFMYHAANALFLFYSLVGLVVLSFCVEFYMQKVAKRSLNVLSE